MTDNVLDSYLIALGFKVDQSSSAKATAAIAKFAVEVAGLAAAVTAAAAGVVAGVAKISSGLEGLYYSSQRIGATVENINALTFAIGQAGGTAGGARSALEGLGSFLRANPGAEGFIRGLGVSTRDANGHMRQTTDILTELGGRLKAMPYARARAIASVLGVDETTLQALFRGTNAASAAVHRMYRLAGLDAGKAAEGATQFMNRLRLFGQAVRILEESVAAKMQGGLGRDVDRLRDRLVANFGRISDAIAWVARVAVRLGDALVTMGLSGISIAESLYDWWVKLDKGTRRWVVGIGLAELALRSLSTGFLATPLGRIIAIGAAVWSLWQDFETFKAGGKSLIDWSKWSTEIDLSIKSFGKLEAAWDKLWPSLKSSAGPFLDWFGKQFASAIRDTMADLTDLADATTAALSGDWKTARDKLAGIGTRETASMEGPERPASTDGTTRGFRNRNPLNLKFNASQDGVMGADGGGFGIYEKMSDGVAAAERQLLLYRGRGLDTLLKIISTWAPKADHNDTDGYTREVSAAMGIDPNARIDVANPAIASKLIAAMARRESGFTLGGADLASGIARATAASGALSRRAVPQMIPSKAGSTVMAGARHSNVTINNTTTVHGAGDARATGKAVEHANEASNNRLLRQMTGPRYA